MRKEAWYEPGHSLFGDLMLMFRKKKVIDKVEQIITALLKEGLKPDTRAYTELIEAYLKYQHESEKDYNQPYEHAPKSPYHTYAMIETCQKSHAYNLGHKLRCRWWRRCRWCRCGSRFGGGKWKHRFIKSYMTRNDDVIGVKIKATIAKMIGSMSQKYGRCGTWSKLGDGGTPVVDPTLYRSLVGSLQYLTFTRPDIKYVVQQVCLYMHDPREPHFSPLKRILRYVQGTLDYGLQLFSSTTDSLIAYLDADWAGFPTTRRSTSGYCVFLGNNLLSWSSKRQPTLSRSSTEAGYRASWSSPRNSFGVESLEKALYRIQALLVDASDKEIKQVPVQKWLNGLKHLAYDIDDILDDLATDAMHPETHHRLDDVNLRLQALENEKEKLGLMVKNGGLEMEHDRSEDRNRKYQTCLVDASRIIGREGDKNVYIHKLLEEPCNENFSVVPIVGLGGVGKTTLAKILYDDKQVNDHFKLKAWVCVSDEWDSFSISKIIFQCVIGETKEFKDLSLLQVALRDQLRDKPFLLVLDDVWSESSDD
nr:NB-ARC domains-containing protein [Tanacetum cinerariifolium]